MKCIRRAQVQTGYCISNNSNSIPHKHISCGETMPQILEMGWRKQKWNLRILMTNKELDHSTKSNWKLKHDLYNNYMNNSLCQKFAYSDRLNGRIIQEQYICTSNLLTHGPGYRSSRVILTGKGSGVLKTYAVQTFLDVGLRTTRWRLERNFRLECKWA